MYLNENSYQLDSINEQHDENVTHIAIALFTVIQNETLTVLIYKHMWVSERQDK